MPSPITDSSRRRHYRSRSRSPSPHRRRRSSSRDDSRRSRHYSRSRSPSSSRRQRRRSWSSSRSRSPSPSRRQSRRDSGSDSGTPAASHQRARDNRDSFRRRSSPPSSSRQERQNNNHGRRTGYTWGGQNQTETEERAEEPPVEVEAPNFGLSGKLAAETNTVNGVQLKYQETPDAAKPTQKWRLYVFKDKEDKGVLYIHRQSCYLVGRDGRVADIHAEHPSVSMQHAAIQFRKTVVKNEVTKVPEEKVRPYLVDLESTNGTFLNGEQIPPARLIELHAKDVIQFGNSTREYVLLFSEQ